MLNSFMEKYVWVIFVVWTGCRMSDMAEFGNTMQEESPSDLKFHYYALMKSSGAASYLL